jgi:hypothetical protein
MSNISHRKAAPPRARATHAGRRSYVLKVMRQEQPEWIKGPKNALSAR